MQVSQVNGHITHAVIGGAATIDFGISSSAEFFNILSSTLYKDQKLAVVREVLCNAWDAHIEAGITDKPVQITLTNDKFVIRDFGKGIHRDDMGLIYGTYGNSTKKNDGNQTGGFGLGCKAPFAYTDHFEVQSSHEGVRTIYTLTKSSAQAMGKPGIVPIASFPTQESGLQVSIDILSPGDFMRFKQLIKRIVRNGDMNMTLNGDPLERIDFDASRSNYLITKARELLDVASPIMVRYGNVIYPVDNNDEISLLYTKITEHLKTLKCGYEEYRIIFQAPPHSIAVTPSRESLSMQEHTIKTLKGLMEGFFAMLKGPFLTECDKYAVEAVDNAVKEVRIANLLSTAECLPQSTTNSFNPDRITELSSMARRYMESNYPKSLAFRKRDLSYRLRAMMKEGLLERGLTQTFLKAMHKIQHRPGYGVHEPSRWLQRNVTGRVLAKMQGTSLDLDRLYVFDPNDPAAPKNFYNKDVPPLVRATQANPRHLFNSLPYLRNIVVLATSKANLFDRCKKHQVFIDMGKDSGFLFYHVGMKKTAKEDAVKFFTDLGMNVVDLTFKQDWEVELAGPSALAVAAPRKPAKVGVPCLTSVLHEKRGIDTRLCLEDSATRITDPEFILKVSTAQGNSVDSFGPWRSWSSKMIVNLFGSKGAITNNSAVYDKYIAKGAQPFEKYMEDMLCDFMLTNQNVREYWAYHPQRVIDQANFDRRVPDNLFHKLYTTSILRDMFGLKDNRTETEKNMMQLWQEYRDSFYYRVPKQIEKVDDYLNNIPLALANLQPVLKFRHSPMLRVINGDELQTILNGPEDSDEVKTAIDILKMALN